MFQIRTRKKSSASQFVEEKKGQFTRNDHRLGRMQHCALIQMALRKGCSMHKPTFPMTTTKECDI